MTRHEPWQRAADGAGLLAPDGSVAPTIFAEMSAIAVQTGALNLGQGFPDEDGPAEVLEAARHAIATGVNQYPPGLGMPVLREAIARHQKRFYGLTVDPATQVLVTAGATEALAATLLALVDHGDEVVTFEPFYDAYGALTALARGTLRTVPLRFPDFTPDHDALRAAVGPRTRVILVNTPHNPTGAVFDRETLELIVELAHLHDAIIVTDEVYEHLTFGQTHIPIASIAGGFERTVTISSGGKTFSTTGWKIGWITAPAFYITRILAVKQYLTFVNGAPFQPAIAVGLDLPGERFAEISATLESKRDLLVAGLESAGFAVSIPDAGYFVVADARELGVTDATDFCRELPARAGVVGIPLTAFVRAEARPEYSTLVRFAFCKRRDVLDDAVTRLAKLGV
ncbi:aminotransferase class I/II-fold pyridoxal phosphate-dependent enzyme [Agromyces atrinae]|uniref:Aminotransferase class I/II-fold pyridoxal phosphate-dependent enzyme n=1 Tax=Agromyces atrinae TaxID=592376 RepID=A0A4Q2LZZ0_9MICO|nr:aminotransferase class I/II-fold pyridoxal phosphate-dependent enzyme [Agromyces atrinae]NYD65615.1 N-succinyldiaminopimelate aminotransferase [Agromyces atrinae]RXZ84998.1 aminotransferase class I/II-fold pyridoxal phosphate-dependent enzyme [Agromyces atrinae]